MGTMILAQASLFEAGSASPTAPKLPDVRPESLDDPTIYAGQP